MAFKLNSFILLKALSYLPWLSSRLQIIATQTSETPYIITPMSSEFLIHHDETYPNSDSRRVLLIISIFPS